MRARIQKLSPFEERHFQLRHAEQAVEPERAALARAQLAEARWQARLAEEEAQKSGAGERAGRSAAA